MTRVKFDKRSGNKLSGLPIKGQQFDSSSTRISAAGFNEEAPSACSEHIAIQATNSHMKTSVRDPDTIFLNGIRSKIMKTIYLISETAAKHPGSRAGKQKLPAPT